MGHENLYIDPSIARQRGRFYREFCFRARWANPGGRLLRSRGGADVGPGQRTSEADLERPQTDSQLRRLLARRQNCGHRELGLYRVSVGRTQWYAEVRAYGACWDSNT